MKIRFRRSRRWAWAAYPLLALALCGCSSTDLGSGTDVKAREPVNIYKGMKAEDLVAQLGKPAEVREASPPTEGMEVWVYRMRFTQTRLAVTGTKETVHFDPITGAYTPIMDPEVKPETASSVQEVEILLADGEVVAWKSDLKEEVRYN